MFEDRTFERILGEMLAQAPQGVDTRQGSIFYDAVAACAFKLARFYVDAACAFDLVFIATATGEYLDRRGEEYNVTRNPSTAAQYHFLYEGARPTTGVRFFADGKYFVLSATDGELFLDAEEFGAGSNAILEGTPATPVNTIDGLTAASFGALAEPGADKEEDDAYRKRIQEKIGGPAQNGNKQHYKTWCEEIAGVGRARILPLWNGKNTVKGVLYDTEGLPATQSVVDRVQEYIDPGSTGLGEGKANIGAYFTAVAAEPVELTVSFSAILVERAIEAAAKAAAETAIKAYFKELSLETADSEPVIVRVSRIGALLYALPQILDYSALTINDQSGNVEIFSNGAPVLKEVKLVVAVR